MRSSDPSGPGFDRVLATLAAVVVCLMLGFGLGRLPLLQPDEGRNAEVAREMKVSGAWLVPTYNGVDYLDKPAFYFKIVALSLAAFGDNETAARLPSALFAAGLIGMAFAFCRRVYRSTRVAWLAVIVVATMPLYFGHARIVIFDMALTFFACGAIFAGFLAEETEGRARRNWYLLASAAAGLATLVKGPVGFAVPLLVLLASHGVNRRRGAWKRLFAPLNFLVFFAVTLPWFVSLCRARPDFLYYGLVEETFNRFTSAEKFQRDKPFYYYAVLVAGTFFPWSLLLLEAVLASWRQRWFRHRADILCAVWCLAVVLFFSTSKSKQPGYILSVTVACGILVARLMGATLTDPAGRAARLVANGTMVIVGLSLGGLMLVAGGAAAMDRLAPLLDLSADEARRFVPLGGPLAIGLVVCALAGSLGLIRRSPQFSFLSFAAFLPLFLIFNVPILELALESKSGRTVSDALGGIPRDTELASLECFPNGASFYLGRTFTLISADGGELTSNYIPHRLARSKKWPANIVPVAELDRWLATRTAPVFLIARARARERLEKIAATRGAAVEPVTDRYCGARLPAPRGN